MVRGKRRDDPEDEELPEPGHNSELTEDERRALHFQHVTEFKQTKAVLTKAQADHKNVCKRIKSEGGSVTDIKLSIQLESDEGEEALREEFERMMRIARWNATALGTQLSLLDEDRTPSEDRAFEGGKLVGLKGAPMDCPYDPSVPQYARWIEGFHEGQAVLAQGIRRQEPQTPVEAPVH